MRGTLDYTCASKDGRGVTVEQIASLLGLSSQAVRGKFDRYGIEPSGSEVRLPNIQNSGRYNVRLYDEYCMLRYFIYRKIECTGNFCSKNMIDIAKKLNKFSVKDFKLYENESMIAIETCDDNSIGMVVIWDYDRSDIDDNYNTLVAIDFDMHNALTFISYLDAVQLWREFCDKVSGYELKIYNKRKWETDRNKQLDKKTEQTGEVNE